MCLELNTGVEYCHVDLRWSSLAPRGEHGLGRIEAKQQCVFTCVERRSSFNNSKGTNERSAVRAAWTPLNELELKGHALEPQRIPGFECFE